MKKIALIGCLALAITGCTTVGPAVVKRAHRPYNESLVESWKEQMLLNVVRLRYRDNPFFLDVTGINSSHVLSASLGTSYKINPHGSAGEAITPNIGIGYDQKPTITYAPLRGKNFVKQMLEPLSRNSMLKLSESGWSMERVFSICVERTNNMINAETASGPTPDYAPEYKEFAQWASLMRKLQQAHLIDIGKEFVPEERKERRAQLEELGISPDTKDGMVLRIRRDESHETEINEFLSLLGAPLSSTELKFSGNFVKHKESKITMQTRSLLGILFYLSQGIDVPQEHTDRGLVTVTLNKDGSVFDWNNTSGRFMKIRSQKSEPKNTDLKIKYRDYWFYIAEDDLNSKSSFMLLTKLFNLQGGAGGGSSPVLTLPVGV